MKPSEIAFGLIRIPIDFLMAVLAFIFAYRLRSIIDLIPGVQLPLDLSSFPPLNQYTTFSIIASIGLLTLFAFNKMYALKATNKTSKELSKVIIVTSAWLMVLIAYFFLIRSFPFSRLALIYTWILTILLICSGRLLIRFLQLLILNAGIGKKKILFIGNNSITQSLSLALIKDKHYEIAGFIDHASHSFVNDHNQLPYLGVLEDLSSIIKEHQIEEIIQTKTDLSHLQAAEILDFCREHHLSFSFVPNLVEVQQANIETETLAGIPVIKIKQTPLDGWGSVLKRTFDLLAAIVGLIILSPIFLIVTILIKLDSKGTVFFTWLDDGKRVKRVGRQGGLFNFYKFRSMYPKTHNLRYTELASNNTREGSPVVKIKDDPRVTRIGKFLRKTSIDEFPQLINVLKGEMSLVGPRPHLPEEVAKYQKHHKFVLTIKPGITGMAQISGRSDLNFEEEIKLDTYYIEHWSLWLDLKILLKTFGVVLRGYKE